MNYPALIAALPQETIDAVSANPQSLTDASRVTVAENWEVSTLSPRALWLVPPDYT